MGRHWHQLTHTDRLRIEANLNVGRTPRHIADMLHVHISTIYREVKRGRYTHMNSDLTTDERYSPRKQFGYHTSREQFEKYMEDIFGGATPGDIPRRDGPSLTR